ncbi:MAG: sigma-70 family RNA polymerase sigma factor [Acidobacteriota bacterium]|nr:sigma-70 family RNA polymerase sigma factor [Blastocatellia bacterium]MDW8240951.1 sigma-70 family RNA polymerase sigma factor [Acidobacteriota bacterium]
MNHQWSFEQYEPSLPIQRFIEQQVSKLERSLRRLAPDSASLQGRVAKPKRKRLYEVTLKLTWPESSIEVAEKGREVRALLRTGFKALDQLLKRYQPPSLTERANQARAQCDDQTKPLPIEQLIDRHLPFLTGYVRRAMEHFQATGELDAEAVPSEAIIDETVMRAMGDYQANPPTSAVEDWLARLADEVFKQRIEQEQQRREAATQEEQPVEQRLSRVSPQQKGSAVEDEMYIWYQPDEKLHWEDIVPDPHVPSPEEIVARRQFQQEIEQVIATLPKRWRDVFVLHTIEDFTLEQVCLVTGQSLEEVQRDYQAARDFLRRQLARAEWTTTPSVQRAVAS